MESKEPLLLDMDNMMYEEENVIDPKSAVQFGAVLKEMQSIFCRKEGSMVKEQEFVTDLKSEMNDDFAGFLTTPPSWCLEHRSDLCEVAIDETLNFPVGEGVGGTKLCDDMQVLIEVLDEEGETGYHSMTTTSSDSLSLDSLSPSPTSSVGIVRALKYSSPPPSKRNCADFLQLPDKILVNNLLPLLGTQDLVRLSASCRRLQRLCW